jgi:hypothetical protein
LLENFGNNFISGQVKQKKSICLLLDELEAKKYGHQFKKIQPFANVMNQI